MVVRITGIKLKTLGEIMDLWRVLAIHKALKFSFMIVEFSSHSILCIIKQPFRYDCYNHISSNNMEKYKHQFVKMMSRRIVFEVSNGQEVEGGLPLPGESDSVI